MRPPSSSHDLQRWLTRALRATFVRKVRHGLLYRRACPGCGRPLRIIAPDNREHLPMGTLLSICQQAHVTLQGESRCP